MRDIRQAIQERPWVVLLVVLGFVGPTLGFSLLQTPVYEASTQMLLVPGWGTRCETGIPGIRFIPPCGPPPEAPREAIDKPAIAEEVIKRLGLDGSMEPAELLENLTVEQEEGTFFIQLSYRDTDPQKAQRIANAVVEVSSERISTDDMKVTVWDDASVPTDPLSPNPVWNAIVALGVGLMLGMGLALLLEQRSQT